MRPVREVHDAVVVCLAFGQGERRRGGVRWEQPKARPAGEGVDEQVELVDETVGQERADEGAAAAGVQVGVGLVLEAPDPCGVVGGPSKG
jgi:hypothetical protein